MNYQYPAALELVQGVTSAIMQGILIADIEGWTFAAQIRPSPTSPELYAQWEPGQIEAHAYALILPLDPEVTSTWTWSRGVLGIEGYSPEGQVWRILHVPVTLSREIVRPQAAMEVTP